MDISNEKWIKIWRIHRGQRRRWVTVFDSLTDNLLDISLSKLEKIGTRRRYPTKPGEEKVLHL